MVTTTTVMASGMIFDQRKTLQGVSSSYVLVALVIGVLLGALIVLAALRSTDRIRSTTRR